jgi:hypothetical protein
MFMDNPLSERIRELSQHVKIRFGRDTQEDAQAFLKLNNSLYARRVDKCYYSWQFFETPFRAWCLFGLDRGRLVGCGGIRLYPILSGSDSLAGLLVDSMIEEKYRGIGLFARIEIELEQAIIRSGAKYMYALPNKAGYLPRVTHLGWTGLQPIITYVRQTGGRPRRLTGMIQCEKVEKFDGAINEIWNAFLQLYPSLATVRRNAAYLNWRFAENPRYRYDLFKIKRNGQLFGYLVLKEFKDPMTGRFFGDIVDILWREDDKDTLACMLSFALDHFEDHGIEEATIWLQTNTIIDDVGRELGFNESAQKRYFCVKFLDERYSWVTNLKRWFITMADSEIF